MQIEQSVMLGSKHSGGRAADSASRSRGGGRGPAGSWADLRRHPQSRGIGTYLQPGPVGYATLAIWRSVAEAARSILYIAPRIRENGVRPGESS